MRKKRNSISVIIPVYNEEKSLRILYKRLLKVLKKNFSDWEIIFVTNGCTDSSYNICHQLAKAKNVKHFNLRKANKSLALDKGIKVAKKKYVATVDADLQDQPEELIKVFERLKKDNLDCVIGWRKNRQDNFEKKLLSGLFNFINRRISGLEIHDFNSGLKIFRREAFKEINLYGEMHRFIPLMINNLGFKTGEIVVRHSARKYGKSKYNFSRSFRAFFDFLTILFINKYIESPLHFFGPIGLLFLLSGFIINSYLSYLWFTGQGIGPRPLLTLGVLLMVLGAQFFSTGFLGELFINVFSKKKVGKQD